MAVGERDEEYDESIADKVVRDTRPQRMTPMAAVKDPEDNVHIL